MNNTQELNKITPFIPDENQRYYSANRFFSDLFGKKTYKLSFDAGFGCPNRDGKISYGGCIFCGGGGGGVFAVKLTADNLQNIDDAFAEAKARVSEKIKTNSYIAYFQSYSNTYAPTETLDKLYSAVIARSDVCALSIATRPDCFTDETYDLIKRLGAVKPVFVELGLQTANEKTAVYINRGYALPVYDRAVARLKAAGANVITHVIIGLPGENKTDILSTIKHATRAGTDGLKLQLLHVLKNTRLTKSFTRGEFRTLGKEEYVDILCDCVNATPANVVIHRLTGDAPKKLLIEPKWSADKKSVLNLITKTFSERNVIQGSKAK